MFLSEYLSFSLNYLVLDQSYLKKCKAENVPFVLTVEVISD